jgi:hypothetical protein
VIAMQTYDLISVAEKAGVVIKSYGEQTIETEFTVRQDASWSWDHPGSAGGCGLPSKYDAAQDACRELRLSFKCVCGAPGVVMGAWTEFECGAEFACDGAVERRCPNDTYYDAVAKDWLCNDPLADVDGTFSDWSDKFIASVCGNDLDLDVVDMDALAAAFGRLRLRYMENVR